MNNIELSDIKDFDFKKVTYSCSEYKKPILFVFTCGYEERSLSQFLYLQDQAVSNKVHYLCFSFTSYRKNASRPKNEARLLEHGIKPIELDATDEESVWDHLNDYFTNQLNGDALVYIDYSSMPRNWYCMLARKLVFGELGKTAAMIYSHGRYSDERYPCVGYGEFHKSSGRPDINATREVNIFGLGFDSIRTHGIWTFLDPQLSISIIARSPENKAHLQRVKKENPEILAASSGVFEVDIHKFDSMLASLIDLSRKYREVGDVALVPDGPKAMVIAMFLVPYYLKEKGVYSWHVGHVKPDNYEPIDIQASGEYFGFGTF